MKWQLFICAILIWLIVFCLVVVFLSLALIVACELGIKTSITYIEHTGNYYIRGIFLLSIQMNDFYNPTCIYQKDFV